MRALALGLIIGVVLMEILAVAGGEWHEHWPAVFLLLIILATGVHELGHLIAGWAVGFRFLSIQVGPFLLESEYGILRPRISFDIMALGFAGMFPNDVRRLRTRSLVYIAGGPAANFLTVLSIALVSHLVQTEPTSTIATAVGQLAAVSLVLAMISLAPVQSNDGALIEMLLCSPLVARRWISTLALGTQYNRGIRAKQWKQTWIRAATYVPDNSHGEFYANWLAYLSANDRKDVAKAAQHLERCLTLTPSLTTKLRDLAAVEAAVFSAWYRMELHLAEKWRGQLTKPGSLSRLLQIRLETALHCARSDFGAALTTWQSGFDVIQRLPQMSTTSALVDSWKEWKSEIQERQAALTMA